MTKRIVVAVVSTLSLMQCSQQPCNPEIDDDCPFDGGDETKPDFCSTPTDGLMDTANCALPLVCGIDGGRLAYINPPSDAGIDQDWYSAEFGALTARSLVHVQAGYVAPSTAVDLAVTVLHSDAMNALRRVVDDHGQGAPKVIDLVFPYHESNTKLLFLAADKGGRPPVYDLRNPYFISVCTQDDPDVNEPNDDAGTPLSLASSGMVLTGMASGYLSTDGDVDRFVFDAPANMPAARNIIYLHITTAMPLMPPPPYRLSYTLLDPSGVPIAEGVADNAFNQVDLAAAKLVRTPGRYTVVVRGYKTNPNDPAVIPGDLRQQYTISVTLMGDLDMNEGNDTMAEAASKVMSLTAGQSVQKVGRLSYTPDPEWFGFDVSTGATPATLRVKVRAAQMAGRFAPLAGPVDRQLRVMASVPPYSGNPAQSVANCLGDSALCPKGYVPQDQNQRDLVARICTGFADGGAAQCLMMERNQNNDANHFKDLKNLEGIIPIPANTNARYWVVFGDEGNNWADDAQWTLDIAMNADPDEARGSPVSGSLPGSVNGELTFGFGRTTEYDLQRCAEMPQTCEGLRNPYDYDAVPTDIDTYSFSIPGGGASDQGWGLQWDVYKTDAGSLPGQLSLQLAFCGTATADGGCSIRRGPITYQSGTFSPWYSSAQPDRVVGWSRADMGSFVRITAEANQCLCLQRGLTRIDVGLAVTDRDSYAPLRYTVTQTTPGGYPYSFSSGDGGSAACPSPQADGGGRACEFPCKLGSGANCQ